MPYVMTRTVANLEKGVELKYDKGELPDALKFSAEWVEPKPKPKKEKSK